MKWHNNDSTDLLLMYTFSISGGFFTAYGMKITFFLKYVWTTYLLFPLDYSVAMFSQFNFWIHSALILSSQLFEWMMTNYISWKHIWTIMPQSSPAIDQNNYGNLAKNIQRMLQKLLFSISIGFTMSNEFNILYVVSVILTSTI